MSTFPYDDNELSGGTDPFGAFGIDEIIADISEYMDPDELSSLISGTGAEAPSRKRARVDFEFPPSPMYPQHTETSEFSMQAPSLTHEMPAILPPKSSLIHEDSQPPAMRILNRIAPDATPSAPLEVYPAPHQQPSTENLMQIEKSIEVIQQQVAVIYSQQQGASVPIDSALFAVLQTDQIDVMNQTMNCHKELQDMLSTLFLSPPALAQVMTMLQEIELIRKKLELCNEELHYYHESSTAQRCFMTLLITKQPFPKPIKQNTKATGPKEEPVEVELLCAPKANYSQTGVVKGKVIKPGRGGEMKKVEIVGAEASMVNGLAHFSDIRFPQGTRKSEVKIQFSVPITYIQPNGTPAEHILDSDLSQPIIVITNENQWKDAEQRLFTHAAFGEGQGSISWPRFFNFLQLHYLRSTRQSITTPDRALTLREYEYIRKLPMFERSNANVCVSLTEFDRFWKWFGEAMHRIRHNRIFNSMWMQGSIYGFIDKQRSNQILGSQPPRSALLRFSERCPGQVAVVIPGQRDDISGRFGNPVHVLLTPAECDHKNLAEVILSKFQFNQIPLVATDFDIYTNGGIRGVITRRQIQQEHCAPEGEPFVPPLGYEPSTDGPYYTDML